MEMKRRVLFICIKNACRSQIAEGFANHYGQEKVDAYSAGSQPAGAVDPVAIQAMEEKGIDISSQITKGFDELQVSYFDYIVTMGCEESCPLYPGERKIDWETQDPKGKGIEKFREVRDEIEMKVIELIGSI